MVVLGAGFDMNFGGGNGFALDALGGNGPGIERKFAQLGFELADVEACVDEGAEDHVAADAGKAVEVSKFHLSTASAYRMRYEENEKR